MDIFETHTHTQDWIMPRWRTNAKGVRMLIGLRIFRVFCLSSRLEIRHFERNHTVILFFLNHDTFLLNSTLQQGIYWQTRVNWLITIFYMQSKISSWQFGFSQKSWHLTRYKKKTVEMISLKLNWQTRPFFLRLPMVNRRNTKSTCMHRILCDYYLIPLYVCVFCCLCSI